jgi:hypothetical protein
VGSGAGSARTTRCGGSRRFGIWRGWLAGATVFAFLTEAFQGFDDVATSERAGGAVAVWDCENDSPLSTSATDAAAAARLEVEPLAGDRERPAAFRLAAD